MDGVRERFVDVIQRVFKDLGAMTVFVPKVGLFKSRLLWIYEDQASSDVLQHIAVDFVHEDQASELAGVFSVSVIFSMSREKYPRPIIHFSLKLKFAPQFSGSGIILYGQEEMVKIMRYHFEALGDIGISVYLEHCNKFEYHKAALLAGSIPGWVHHRRSAGIGYRGLKGHLLYIMDRFLHYDHLGDIPYEDLIKSKSKILQSEGLSTLVPRNWENDRVTTLSFVRIWNCYPGHEYVYAMEGEFWRHEAPEASREYLDFVKEKSPDRVLSCDEVKTYLKENARNFL